MKKILLVDDEFIVRESIKMIFDSKKFIIEEAENGMEALEKVREFKPHLVLLDYDMPCKNGFDVYLELRGNEATFDLPVIFCSGRTDIVGKIMKISNNKVDFIIKPLNVEILKRMLQCLL